VASELSAVVDEFVSALDALDVDRLVGGMADDAQGVDEVSRRWIRGRDELESYLRGLMGAVSAIQTEVRDVTERVWGDAALVTCWMEQDYTLEGARRHVSAPTTIAFRRVDGQWRMTLFHSIPLPEQG